MSVILEGGWMLSDSADPRALELVDGTGQFMEHGPHYSRRTPGSKTFTGMGQEVVLWHPSGAVWACVHQPLPKPPGSGRSRGRAGGVTALAASPWVWRNMMFRNLGAERGSVLIRSAVTSTVWAWIRRYGDVPAVDLRTEVDASAVRSEVAGYCYRRAGWVAFRHVRSLVYFRCPRTQIERAAASSPVRRVIASPLFEMGA